MHSNCYVYVFLLTSMLCSVHFFANLHSSASLTEGFTVLFPQL
jgi:hypothetical protein